MSVARCSPFLPDVWTDVLCHLNPREIIALRTVSKRLWQVVCSCVHTLDFSSDEAEDNCPIPEHFSFKDYPNLSFLRCSRLALCHLDQLLTLTHLRYLGLVKQFDEASQARVSRFAEYFMKTSAQKLFTLLSTSKSLRYLELQSLSASSKQMLCSYRNGAFSLRMLSIGEFENAGALLPEIAVKMPHLHGLCCNSLPALNKLWLLQEGRLEQDAQSGPEQLQDPTSSLILESSACDPKHLPTVRVAPSADELAGFISALAARRQSSLREQRDTDTACHLRSSVAGHSVHSPSSFDAQCALHTLACPTPTVSLLLSQTLAMHCRASLRRLHISARFESAAAVVALGACTALEHLVLLSAPLPAPTAARGAVVVETATNAAVTATTVPAPATATAAAPASPVVTLSVSQSGSGDERQSLSHTRALLSVSNSDNKSDSDDARMKRSSSSNDQSLAAWAESPTIDNEWADLSPLFAGLHALRSVVGKFSPATLTAIARSCPNLESLVLVGDDGMGKDGFSSAFPEDKFMAPLIDIATSCRHLRVFSTPLQHCSVALLRALATHCHDLEELVLPEKLSKEHWYALADGHAWRSLRTLRADLVNGRCADIISKLTPNLATLRTGEAAMAELFTMFRRCTRLSRVTVRELLPVELNELPELLALRPQCRFEATVQVFSDNMLSQATRQALRARAQRVDTIVTVRREGFSYRV